MLENAFPVKLCDIFNKQNFNALPDAYLIYIKYTELRKAIKCVAFHLMYFLQVILKLCVSE